MPNPNIPFDVQFARIYYPYFQINGVNPIAFFNNAGGTFVCKQVIDELTDFIFQDAVSSSS